MLLRATPVRESRLLRLIWQLPPERLYSESKAMALLTALLSQSGEGGLEWLLTQQVEPPLATSVSGAGILNTVGSRPY